MWRVYAREELNELLSIFEEDLLEMLPNLDAEHTTRLCQSLYLFKTADFEPLWWRVEDHINEHLLAKLDTYHVTNILRSMTHCQDNRMVGKDKTFYNMEPTVVKGFKNIGDRDLSHLMYCYGNRNAGNPELHALFEKKLTTDHCEYIRRLDYASLFNVVYYLLFRENTNTEVWTTVVDRVLAN